MRAMRTRHLLIVLLFALVLPGQFGAQAATPSDDFSITLRRVGCLGSCPDYEVTIRGNGQVRYQGNSYVHVEGVRDSKVTAAEVERLMKRLQDESFLQWEENDKVCLDLPAVHIIVRMSGQQKHVVEGCDKPGKILQLADEIDAIAGSKRWVAR